MRSPKQDLQTIPPEHPDYPAGLKTCTAFKTAPTLTAIGNLSLLQNPAIAHTAFIAYAAPNSKTQAFAQRLVQTGKSVVTFNSPNNLALQQHRIIFLDFDALK
jgi:hypothetical protein